MSSAKDTFVETECETECARPGDTDEDDGPPVDGLLEDQPSAGGIDGYCYTIEWQKVSFVLRETENMPQIVGGTHVQPNDPRFARLLSARRSLLNGGGLAYSAAYRIYIC